MRFFNFGISGTPFCLLTLMVHFVENGSSFHIHYGLAKPSKTTFRSTTLSAVTSSTNLESLSKELEQSLDACRSDIAKTCNVAVGLSKIDASESGGAGRLGLVATKKISKGDVILAMPYDERVEFSAAVARKVVYKGVLDEEYDGWTGDTGLIALLILNELARAAEGTGGIEAPKRTPEMQTFFASWIKALPSAVEMNTLHPIFWSEEDQEVLQQSSTTKIYRTLDDLEEDATWLVQNVFSKNRERFPESVLLDSEDGEIPCFSLDGFKWAMALVQSRSIFLDGAIRLIPILDMCNHDDYANEISGGFMGTFGTLKGAKLVASKSYKVGEEVLCSYGPKSAADYLLEHGFCPPQCWKTAVSEMTFEIDPEDRFYDDKMDILEYETYDQAPMDPVQSFDVVSGAGTRDGDPDPAMVQFVRLCKLGGTDAFLLESIFRKEVWGFMAYPVSEKNELDVVNAISESCQQALDELSQCPTRSSEDETASPPGMCKRLRESESKALMRTVEFLQREKEALDLKEYYQERRLKDLGLDSEWSPEDDMSEDLGFGQTRVPGGADYDW